MHIPHAGENIKGQKYDCECTEDRGDNPAYKYVFGEFLKACKIDLSHFIIPFLVYISPLAKKLSFQIFFCCNPYI